MPDYELVYNRLVNQFHKKDKTRAVELHVQSEWQK